MISLVARSLQVLVPFGSRTAVPTRALQSLPVLIVPGTTNGRSTSTLQYLYLVLLPRRQVCKQQETSNKHEFN